MSEEPRPPYVKFEYRAIEDRTASEEAGSYRTKDVLYAIVTPSGSKDRLEKVASEWIEGLKEGARQERIPQSWVSAYVRAMKDFEESRETPIDGTSIKEWPMISQSQVNMLLDLNIRTVEDLSQVSEEAISLMGMGARALKSKAQAWLDSASKNGKVASELASLRQASEAMKAALETKDEQIKTLQMQLKTLLPQE